MIYIIYIMRSSIIEMHNNLIGNVQHKIGAVDDDADDDEIMLDGPNGHQLQGTVRKLIINMPNVMHYHQCICYENFNDSSAMAMAATLHLHYVIHGNTIFDDINGNHTILPTNQLNYPRYRCSDGSGRFTSAIELNDMIPNPITRYMNESHMEQSLNRSSQRNAGSCSCYSSGGEGDKQHHSNKMQSDDAMACNCGDNTGVVFANHSAITSKMTQIHQHKHNNSLINRIAYKLKTHSTNPSDQLCQCRQIAHNSTAIVTISRRKKYELNKFKNVLSKTPQNNSINISITSIPRSINTITSIDAEHEMKSSPSDLPIDLNSAAIASTANTRRTALIGNTKESIAATTTITTFAAMHMVKRIIHWLLIVNCLAGIVNGNLMSRTIGQNNIYNQSADVSNQHTNNNPQANQTINKHPLSTVTPLPQSSAILATNRNQLTNLSMRMMQSSRHQTHPTHHIRNQSNFPDLYKMHEMDEAKRLHNHQNRNSFAAAYSGTDEPFDVHKLVNGRDNTEKHTRCVSCQYREELKAHNLDTIKMHILERLSMRQPPNITSRPHISEQILQSFYQNNDFRYIRVRDTNENERRKGVGGGGGGGGGVGDGGSGDIRHNLNEMQGDDPMTSDNYPHHIYENRRIHDMKSGFHDIHSQQRSHQQHHYHSYHHNNMKYENGDQSESSSKYSAVPEYNEEYDYGMAHNANYDDEQRITTLFGASHFASGSYDMEEPFYSSTDFIYSFPKLSKARHRGDILEFTVKNNQHLSVVEAAFYLYVRGEDWIFDNDPTLLANYGRSSNSKSSSGGSINDEVTHTGNKQIAISLNRFIHRHPQQVHSKSMGQQHQQHQRYTRTDSDFVGDIPEGDGKWIRFNITHMITEWMEQQQMYHKTSNSASTDIVQEVVIKTLDTWMRQLLVLDTTSKNSPYIEIQTKDIRKHRNKRHVANDCRENERQSRCCRYPLRVDFRKFGWDWIIAPDIYEAYFCAGECPIGYETKYAHSYISGLSSSFSSCCSPRKLSPLSLLYFDDNKQVIHSVIPNMAVEHCGCS